MRLRHFFMALALLAPSPLQAQFAPLAAKPPDEATLKAIKAKTAKLEETLTTLRTQNVRDPGLADAEVFLKAAAWIVRHSEFYQANYGEWTLAVLDHGLLRASQLAQGEAPWLRRTGQTVVRAYRSRIDGSLQPFAVTLPADYGKNPRLRWRIDVVLHGRDASLTEVKFLHQHGTGKAVPREQDFIRIDIYGRGNVAYRWAGEADVFEALDQFHAVERLLGRERLLDPNRVVLRGFSMGGAGTWHLGLHHPDRWCVIGPGAGFTVTHGYVKGLPAKLPAYQESCLRIYDAADYAENAVNVPVVAYSGSADPQMEAAVNIEKRLKPLGIPMTHLIAQGLGHSFPPEWQKKAEAEYARFADSGKPDYPKKVRFVTYTARYSSCAWVEILGLERHYQKSLVEAERNDKGFQVKTTNIHAIRLGLPETATMAQVVKIDGQEISALPYRSGVGLGGVYLEKRAGRWESTLPQRWYVDNIRRPRKTLGKQGPIDDAFMDTFLCVRGTGKPWHEATQQYAEKNLERFRQEWDKFLRGRVPIKDDVDVTEQDLNNCHLILFGDPASNSLLGQALSGLPLRWTKESIVLAGKSYSSANHVPVMIYPSPVNATRYIVLNSGHTFHAADFRGTNALLYPRLGDYAVLKLIATDKDPLAVDVVTAGLFDDDWQLPKTGDSP